MIFVGRTFFFHGFFIYIFSLRSRFLSCSFFFKKKSDIFFLAALAVGFNDKNTRLFFIFIFLSSLRKESCKIHHVGNK